MHFFDDTHVIVIDEVAMGQNRMRRQQAEPIQTQRIGFSVTIEHICVFPIALGTMSLYVTIGALRHLT